MGTHLCDWIVLHMSSRSTNHSHVILNKQITSHFNATPLRYLLQQLTPFLFKEFFPNLPLCLNPICILFKVKNNEAVRPRTSQRQQRWLHLCPLVFALMPLKCSSRNLQFPLSVPFTKEKNALVSLPFRKTKYTGLQTHLYALFSTVIKTKKQLEH